MKKALLVIDVQNYFINEHTKYIPSKIASFIERGRFEFVLFFRFVNSDSSNFVRDLKWKQMFASPDIDIVQELQKFTIDTNVFSKTSFSALQSQEVASYLDTNKITSLFICGFDTDGCVLATAMDAFDKGYKVRVLQDLCGSHHGVQYHQNAIEIIKRNARSVPINSSDA